MPINWKISAEDAELILRIVDRAELVARPDLPFDRRNCVMDLTAVHVNGCKLDLVALLEAGEGDFIHDVWGIRRNIDRRTGRLSRFFTPRLSRRVVRA
jgi:hypothetical protein